MRTYPWGKLPACHLRQIRKLEAYATVRNQLPLALASAPSHASHAPRLPRKSACCWPRPSRVRVNYFRFVATLRSTAAGRSLSFRWRIFSASCASAVLLFTVTQVTVETAVTRDQFLANSADFVDEGVGHERSGLRMACPRDPSGEWIQARRSGRTQLQVSADIFQSTLAADYTNGRNSRLGGSRFRGLRQSPSAWRPLVCQVARAPSPKAFGQRYAWPW